MNTAPAEEGIGMRVLGGIATASVILLIVVGVVAGLLQLLPKPKTPVHQPAPVSPTPSRTPSLLPSPTTAGGQPIATVELLSRDDSIRATSLAWDPAGKLLGYSRTNGQVWMQLAEETTGSLIFSLPEGSSMADLRLAWSPDGGQLAIYGAWKTSDAEQTGLWLLAFSSSEPGELLQVLSPSPATDPRPQANGAVTDVAWSPDGHKLAFTYQAEAWVFDLATGKADQLTHIAQAPLAHEADSAPFDGVQELAWSPDGSRMALGLSCNCPSPWRGLGIMDLAGGAPQLLYDGAYEFDWAPDSRLSFRNVSGDWGAGYTYDFYAIEPTHGAKPVNLTHSNPDYDPLVDPIEKSKDSKGLQEVGLLWRSDGAYLAEANQYPMENCWMLSLAVHTQEGGTVWSAEGTVFPTWLPDGRVAYFQAEDPGLGGQFAPVCHLKRAMAQDDVLFDLDVYASAGAWSPDASSVALLTTTDPAVLPGQVQVFKIQP